MAAAALSTQAGICMGMRLQSGLIPRLPDPCLIPRLGLISRPLKKILGFARLELPESTTCIRRASVEWEEGGGGGGSSSDTTHQLSSLSQPPPPNSSVITLIHPRPPPAGKARKMVEGFEEAVEKNEAEEKLEQQKRQFPGLAMPDNTDRVMKLLKPETADAKIATEAMGEVSWGAGPQIRARGLLGWGGLLLGDPRRC